MNAKIMGVTSNPYYDAPTYVLVFAPSLANNPVQDGSCVLENMMLAAHALGLGSCWIHRERGNVCYGRRQAVDGRVGLGRIDGESVPFLWVILMESRLRRNPANRNISG